MRRQHSSIALLILLLMASCSKVDRGRRSLQASERCQSESRKALVSGYPDGARKLAEKSMSHAEAAARSHGYDVEKYNMTGCHYEYTEKDGTWTVFYELKPPTPPGGHFLVSVDDKTKQTAVAPGK